MSGPKTPTNEVVAIAWLTSFVPDLPAAMVATTLPRANDAGVLPWLDSGFLQVQSITGTPDIDLPVRHPLLQLDAWATTGSRKPAWGQANDIIERVRVGLEDDQSFGQRLDLGPRFTDAIVYAGWLLTEPARVNDDEASYARFTADLALDWARA